MSARLQAVSITLAVLIAGAASAFDLIRGGKPACTVVLPDQATDLEKEGAEKLVTYLKSASGVELPIVKESAGTKGAVLSFGRTAMASKLGITDADLKYDGYRLVARDGTLYVLGRDGELIMERRRRVGAQGSLRAALGLLEQMGFRWLQPTPQGVYLPKRKTYSVPDDLNHTYQPQFMYVAGRMYVWGDWSLANDFRKAAKLYSAGGHTWCLAVPASLWKEHPDYFQLQGGKRVQPVGHNFQLCPTHPDVIRLISKFTIKKMEEGFDVVALGQPDGYQPCECDRCRKLDKPGEHHEQVHHANYLAALAAYKKYPNKKVHLLVYGPTRTASSRFEQYPPNTITEVCLTGSLANLYGSHEAGLEFWKQRIPGGATVYVYYMGMYHNVALGPKFTPRAAAEALRMLHRKNVLGIYYCGGGENWGAEGPTYYALGRLAMDPDQEWRELLKQYCDLTYGRAAATMYQYYDTLYGRIDSCHVRGTFGRYVSDAFTAVYTPVVLDRLDNLLTLAERQATEDKRSAGWVQTSRTSFDHVSLIAKAYHLHQAYQVNPARSNLEQTRDAVKAYQAFADGIMNPKREDRKFIKNYLPNPGYWITKRGRFGTLRTNFRTLSSPFTWDFDALLNANFLPGKTRSSAVFTRLKTSPKIDGDPSEEAWQAAPWIDMPEVALGKAEASTRFRIGYDDRNLYFAFECGEPRFDEMKVVKCGRDGKVFNTECVEIFLAPDGAGQRRVQLVVSPSEGEPWDGRYGYIDDPLHPLVLSGRADTSWDPLYQRAYRMFPEAGKWTVEIAFPFAELGISAPDEGTRWRGNLGRERHLWVWDAKKYSRKSELFLWSPNLQKAKFTDPAAFGDLYFGVIPKSK